MVDFPALLDPPFDLLRTKSKVDEEKARRDEPEIEADEDIGREKAHKRNCEERDVLI